MKCIRNKQLQEYLLLEFSLVFGLLYSQSRQTYFLSNTSGYPVALLHRWTIEVPSLVPGTVRARVHTPVQAGARAVDFTGPGPRTDVAQDQEQDYFGS